MYRDEERLDTNISYLYSKGFIPIDLINGNGNRL